MIKKLYCKHDKSKTCEEYETQPQQTKCPHKSFWECIGEAAPGICIHDTQGKKPCLLEDPNLCKFDYYHQCLESNGKSIPSKPVGIPPNLDPVSESKANPKNGSYDVNDGKTQIIQEDLNSAIDCTIPEFDNIEMATSILKELIGQEDQQKKIFAGILLQVKEKFFSEKGKKKGWKNFIEINIQYHYRHTQELIRGYQHPIINEYWEQLGIAKITLLNRYKEPITPKIIEQIIPLSVREAQKNLFPRFTKSKDKRDNIKSIIEKVKGIKPKELNVQARKKLITTFESAIKELRKK